MKTAAELEAHLLEKAGEDEIFRAKLLSDPPGAIKDATGLTVPEGINVNVHESTSTEMHLVLPPTSGEISDAELRDVSGSGSDMGGW